MRQRVLVALNFSTRDLELHLGELGNGNLVLSTCLDRNGAIDLSNFTLRGDEGIVVELSL